MPLLSHLTLSFTTTKRIKMAVDFQCEICGQEQPIVLLEIHYIPGSSSMKRSVKVKDLQREILVLCPTCHHDIHAFSVTIADQKKLISYRSKLLKERIRLILKQPSKPYTPPECDLEKSYEESLRIPNMTGY